MYEFVDGHGELVTVRSDRTLERLLSIGRITATTRFRLENERSFVPAGEHPAAIASAEQAGVRLGNRPKAPPSPAEPPPAADAAVLPAASEPKAAAPRPVEPAPVLFKPRPVPPTARGLEKEPKVIRVAVPLASPWDAPPRGPVSSSPAGGGPAAVVATRAGAPEPYVEALQGVGTAFLALLASVVIGMVGGGLAEALLKNYAIGVVATAAVAAYAGKLAGRALATRRMSTHGQVSVAAIVFLFGCVLTGWTGTVVGIPLCFVLWTAFSDHEIRR